MNRWLLSAFVLALIGLASPAGAIELFTNFNNGTELGTRPYGIPEMPPVRYHWWQKNYCPPPEMQPPATMPRAPAQSNMRMPSSGPAIVQPQSSSDQTGPGAGDAIWLRGTSVVKLEIRGLLDA